MSDWKADFRTAALAAVLKHGQVADGIAASGDRAPSPVSEG